MEYRLEGRSVLGKLDVRGPLSDLRPRDRRLLETLETECLPEIWSLYLETDRRPDMSLLVRELPDTLSA